MAEVDLDEMERLEREATAATWEYDEDDGGIECSGGGYVGWIQDHGNVRTAMRTGEPRKNADGRLIVALRNAFPALLAELRTLRRERAIEAPQLAVAWASANRMHKVLGGIAPWDGGPLLFEMNEIALDKKLHSAVKTARSAALEEAAKVCEERMRKLKAEENEQLSRAQHEESARQAIRYLRSEMATAKQLADAIRSLATNGGTGDGE